MAKVLQQAELNAFRNKTIQPSNWFVVQFPPIKGMNIPAWVVTDVQIQEPVDFQKVGNQLQGRPFSRPVMKETDGYEFQVSMEETEDWRVQKLIHLLETMNINPDGTHTSLQDSIISSIDIYVLSPRAHSTSGGEKRTLWSFHYMMEHCFFVGADSVSFDYGSPGKIKRRLTFCCNRIVRELADEYVPEDLIDDGFSGICEDDFKMDQKG